MKKACACRLMWGMVLLALLCRPAGAQQAAPGPAEQPGQTGSQPSAPEGEAGVISESQLVGLPLNGRSYSQLATLEGGVSDPFGGGKQGGGSGGLTVSGGRGEWNSFLLDGTDINGANNQVPRSAAGGQLGADTTAQVQVFSTNYAAQYGRAAGGVLNAISRSGSNNWHGTFFEFLRNSKLDARNFFDSGDNPPPFKRNQFGGTVSGPIRRDRLFFMSGFEILKNRLTETYVSIVPDSEARQGLLFPVDPRVRPYLNLFPSPDVPLGGGFAENRTAVSLPADEYFFVGRIDQQVGDSDAWFLRYTFDDAATRVVEEGSPTFPTRSESRQQYLTFAHTHFFSPRLLNSLRLGYTRPVVRTESEALSPVAESLFFVPGAPQFGRLNVPGITPFGPDPLLPSSKVMNTYQVSEDVLWNRGRHSFRAGMQLIRFQWNVFDNASASGEWTFSGMEDFLTLEQDKFLAGQTAGTTDLRVALPGSSADRAFRQTLLGLYLQDAYRLRSNFTMNLGLRYEFTSIISDTRGRTVFLNDEFRDTQPQVGPLMRKNPSVRNFAPRIGLSWSPDRAAKTLLSAGFGIYFDQISEYMVDGKRNTPPFVTLVARTNFVPYSVFPNAVAAGSGAAASRQVRIFEYPNPKTPTVYRYHLSLQQEIAAGLSARASYVGARGNHLVRRYESNLFSFPVTRPDGRLFLPPNQGPLNPNFSSIDRSGTDTQSFYNSLLLSVSRSPWKGLSVDASYTLAKAIDEGSSAGNFTRHYGLNRKLDRALAFFHVTHRFVLNYFYNLPFGRGQRWGSSGWIAHLLGNWRVGGIFNLRTGLAVDPFYRIPEPGFIFVSGRPDLAPGRSNNPVEGVTTCQIADRPAGEKLGTRDRYFDPCAFVPPEPGTIGNAGRNTIIGPKVSTLDLSLQKDFAIDSERSLQLRVEFFNLPNHTNFSEPGDDAATIFADSQGHYNAGAGQLSSTATNSRQIQFALRFSF
ncbi:MAG TPA: TonB-dependent receptor [Terriglobia bacterium]|nr:TonB-dependent receptor [Terriglobia bacterium]